jgi:hypothetical protein
MGLNVSIAAVVGQEQLHFEVCSTTRFSHQKNGCCPR